MVGQNRPQFPAPNTINTPLTPRQAERAAQFLAMLTLKAAPGVGAGAVPAAAPDVDKAQEQTAPRCRSKAHHKPRKATPPAAWVNRPAAAPEAQERQEERPVWLVTPEELDAYESTPTPAPKMQRQVQRQAVPLLADLLDLEQFRPKRGRGAGTAGAGALAVLLDEYARTALAHRLYLYDEEGRPPRQIVLHLCAELIAATLKVSENTVRDWTAQLTEAGYLYARAHHTTATLEGEQVTVVDGMLYAVRLAPATRPACGTRTTRSSTAT